MPMDFPHTHLGIVFNRIQNFPHTPIKVEEALRLLGFNSKNNGAAKVCLYSTIYYGLFIRDYESRTVQLTPIAIEALKKPHQYKLWQEIAFTPQLFQWLRDQSKNTTQITRKQIRELCRPLRTTEYDVAIITRSYFNTLRFLNNLSLGFVK
jgi:hypothetical protein